MVVAAHLSIVPDSTATRFNARQTEMAEVVIPLPKGGQKGIFFP